MVHYYGDRSVADKSASTGKKNPQDDKVSDDAVMAFTSAASDPLDEYVRSETDRILKINRIVIDQMRNKHKISNPALAGLITKMILEEIAQS